MIHPCFRSLSKFGFSICLLFKVVSIFNIITFQELSLAGLGLGDVPSDVWKTSDITKINLSGNSIEELPSALSSCVSLEVNII